MRPWLVVLILFSACATTSRRVGELRPDDPSWLRAGGQRVRFIGELRTPEDLGIERGFWARLWNALTGEAEGTTLSRPSSLAIASDGRIAVADPGNRSVRLFDPAHSSHVRITHEVVWPIGVAFAGPLLVVADAETRRLLAFDARGVPAPLPFAVPELVRPVGLAWDELRHRLFVVDAGAHRLVVLNDAGPRFIGGRGDAPGSFNFPTHVAWANEHLYVADSLNFRVQVFDAELKFVRAFGGAGDTPGDLPRPKGLAVEPDGTVWVVDGAFDAVQGFASDGELVSVIGGAGRAAGRFWLPAGAAIDSTGRLFIADTWNARVQVFSLHAEGAR